MSCFLDSFSDNNFSLIQKKRPYKKILEKRKGERRRGKGRGGNERERFPLAEHVRKGSAVPVYKVASG